MNIKERILRNTSSKVLTESIEDKIKEIEIKDRATRIITGFQRDLLSLVQYVNNGGSYGYAPTEAAKMSEEDIKKYKKICFAYLMSKVGGLKEDILEAFELTEDDQEKEEPKETEVTVVAQAPAMTMQAEKQPIFGY